MRLPKIPRGIRLLALAIPLASCLVDERTDWNNPDDPRGSAWRDHVVSIVAPGFYPQDSLVLEVGTRLKLIQNYSVEPAPGQDPLGTWTFRDLADGTTFSIPTKAMYAPIDTLLPRGAWMVRSDARSPRGASYLPDSMILLVVDTGAAPRLRLPQDTVVFVGPSSRPIEMGIDWFKLPLEADDPGGRRVAFAYSVQRDDGSEGPGRWTDSIEFVDVDGWGVWRVHVEATSSVGLHDTGNFLVTFRPSWLEVDQESYRIGRFGTQVWMLENLRTVPSTSGGSWCYDDDPESCATKGRLYDWTAATAGQGRNLSNGSAPDFATRIRGICPAGWHLPSFDEAMVLKAWLKRAGAIPGPTPTELLPDELVGRALESRSGWNAFWPDDGWRGTTGFDLLPAGTRDPVDGTYRHAGAHGGFWTSSHYASDSARFMGVYENEFPDAIDSTDERSSLAGMLLQIDADPRAGFSVRCLED